MKKIYFTLCFSIISVAFATSLSAQAISIEDCYSVALKKSSFLSIQIEHIDQAQRRIENARAVSFPSLNLDSNVSYQDQPDNAQAKSFFPANQSSSKIQLSLPLFKGFRDIAALNQKKLEKTAQDLALERAKRQLFDDVSQVFFTILMLEQDLKNYEKEIDADTRRKKELITLKRLARAKDSDIVTIESTIATLEVSKETVQGQLDEAREALSFLTDLPTTTKFSHTSVFPESLPPLDNWLNTLNDNPAIKESIVSLDASKEALRQAKGEYYPIAAFNTNYYLTRPGIFSDIKWDLGFTVSIPLLSKKTVEPRVKEAESIVREKEFRVTQKKDEESHNIRAAWIQVQATSKYVKRLETAVQLSSQRYQLLVKDNQQGVATNLDVLQALAGIYQTQRTLDHAKIMLEYNYKKLENIAGKRRASHDKNI